MNEKLQDLLNNRDQVINTNQLMDIYHIKRITVERWRREGLPCTKINNKIFFKSSEVVEWITNNKTDQLF